MRLIDADALKIDYIYPSTTAGTLCYRYVSKEQIDRAPTIDDEPVRRGRWVEGSGMFMCSVCHDVWSTENEEMIKGFNYCPWCGAKMEEQE